MIDITSGNRHLKITPYERLTEPEEPAYSRIMVWVEFSIPALKTEFAAEFFVGQLEQFRNDTHAFHQALTTGERFKDINLTSAFEQVVLNFHQAHFAGAVGVAWYLSLKTMLTVLRWRIPSISMKVTFQTCSQVWTTSYHGKTDA
jgi:hypothetical protein